MNRICRTCLEKTHRTFRVHETTEDTARISDALRYCVPELYLGLSTNPEICEKCKDSLTISYRFKKKCLSSDKLIITFLRNCRATAKSIALEDVLAHRDEQLKEQAVCKSEEEQQRLNMGISTQLENENIQNLEVRQSAPNPTNSQASKATDVKFCELTGQFVNSSNSVLRVTPGKSSPQTLTKSSDNSNNLCLISSVYSLSDKSQDTLTDTAADNGGQKSNQSDSFCRISNVFSLSEGEDLKFAAAPPKETATSQLRAVRPTKSESKVEPDVIGGGSGKEAANSDDAIDVKYEPLEFEENSIMPTTDEDTLDASETGSFENMRCESSLLGIIDNIPEIADLNQYVDIPEFVQINNFGLRDLEQLREQQKQEKEKRDSLPQNNAKLKFTYKPPEDGADKKAIVCSKKPKTEKAPPILRMNANLPDTLIVNGKKMVKFNDGYRLASAITASAPTAPATTAPATTAPATAAPATIIAAGGRSLLKKALVSTSSQATMRLPVPRKKRRLKIVPVKPEDDEEQFQSLGPGDDEEQFPCLETIPKRVKIEIKPDNRDVVVLFTNYTWDGTYVNDHDYLINPYKRNKVLFKQDDEWICRCYICDTTHPVYTHLSHMQNHSSLCPICGADLGTSFHLNLHFRSHKKTWPTELLARTFPELSASGNKVTEIPDFEDCKFKAMKPKRRYYRRRGRKRVDEDGKSISTQSKGAAQETPMVQSDSMPGDEPSNNSEKNSPRRRGGRRGRGGRKNNSVNVSAAKGFRVLRSNVKSPPDTKNGNVSTAEPL